LKPFWKGKKGEKTVLKNAENTQIVENAFWREKEKVETFKDAFLKH
jgi:hypothetical protein